MQLAVTFFYQILILNIFGIGSDLDIFFASNTINIILLAVSTNSINVAITPIFIEYYKRADHQGLAKLASSIFNVLLLSFSLLAIIQYFFAYEILAVILPGFTHPELLKVVDLYRIQAFLSIITILSTVSLAINYTYKRLYRTIIYPITTYILQIIVVWVFSSHHGIYALMYGMIINQTILFLLLSMPYLRLYKLNVIFSKELKNAIRKIFPLIR